MISLSRKLLDLNFLVLLIKKNLKKYILSKIYYLYEIISYLFYFLHFIIK